jgi:hypothetical protein
LEKEKNNIESHFCAMYLPADDFPKAPIPLPKAPMRYANKKFFFPKLEGSVNKTPAFGKKKGR